MNKEKLIPIARGMIQHLPGVKKLQPKRTGGTITSRYCYSVWMRHLKNWNKFNEKIPEIVAELGPGDSLGTGLAALLSGSKHLYSLDVVKSWDNKRNLEIFEELIELFRNKTRIPDNTEYPLVRPKLDDYSFPSHFISDNILNETLSEDRLNAIRKEILEIDKLDNSYIKYKIPWYDSKVINNNTIDFIFSQAVLECIEDLDETFNAMSKWLKPSGLMSHTIDLKSHSITKSWNGHWTFNDFEWNIVKGGKSFLINRQPFSKYVELNSKYGFKILVKEQVTLENKFKINHISKKFRTLSEEEITTSGLYILSKKE
jgi:hypothetical protein